MVVELAAAVRRSETAGDQDEEGDEAEVEALSASELKSLKKELTQAKKRVGVLSTAVVGRLSEVHEAMTGEEAQALVVDLLKAHLASTLDRAVADHRSAVLASAENWWDKYTTTLRSIEAERQSTAHLLDESLRALGYDE